jgi:hypothetical protein
VSAATDDPASTADPITEPTAVVTPASASRARAGDSDGPRRAR